MLWQERNPNLQWPFPVLSDHDPINQSIFLAYTRHSSIRGSHALQGHLYLHWGLLCPPSCCIDSQTIPSNPFNGPGHSSGLYKSILTANGLPVTPLFMGHPTHLPGHHAGSSSWHKSQRPTIIAPSFKSMNCHSHLVFPLHFSESKSLLSWNDDSFSCKQAKNA